MKCFLLQKDVCNFEDTIKTLSQNVPLLNLLTLSFKNGFEVSYIELFIRNFRQLYFVCLKEKGISLSKKEAMYGLGL